MNRNDRIMIPVLFFLLNSLSSCQAIAGIFKAGVWVGVLMVGIVLAIILFIFFRTGKD